MPSEKEKVARIYLHQNGHTLSIGFDDTQDTLLSLNGGPEAYGDDARLAEWVGAVSVALSAAEKERDAHTNTRDVDDSFREGGQKHETRCLERRGPSTRFLCTCGVSDGEVLFAQLRRWEMQQREMWESAFASGAQGSKVGTALGVLDALTYCLNDLQEQSTPEEER